MAGREYELFRKGEQGCFVELVNGVVKTLEQGADSGIGVRVLENGRIGFSYTQDEKDIAGALRTAVKLSRFDPETDFSFQGKARIQKAGTYDKKVAALASDPEELCSIAKQAWDEMGTPKGNIYLKAGVSRIGVENTSGLDAEYRKTGFYIYANGMQDDGSGRKVHEGIGFPEGKNWAGRIGREAGAMARESRNPKRISGTHHVMFSHDELLSLLGFMLASFSGNAKRKGTTRLEPGKRMFDERFSLYDDPLAPASGTCPFDDEGTPAGRKALVEGGTVGGFLYDRETCALAGEGFWNAGACVRGSYASRSGIGASSLVVGKGTDARPEESAGEYVLIESMHGLHTANATTGDFGLEADCAFIVKGGPDGERKPVRGFTVTGNIFNLFNGIESLGRKQRTHSGMLAPGIMFKGIRLVS
ncbi:MAG: TldD/PmbA family protein [Candidatus Bilamarchaeaceae archaeon]